MFTDKLKQFIQNYDTEFPDEDIRKLTDEDIPSFEEFVSTYHPDTPDLQIRQMLVRNAPYMTNMSYKTLYDLLLNKHSLPQNLKERMKIRLLAHPEAPVSAVHEIANDDPSSYYGLGSFDSSVASPRILDELMKYPKLAISLAKQYSDSPLHAHIAKNIVNYPDFINHLSDRTVIDKDDVTGIVASLFKHAVEQGQLQQRDPQKIIVLAKLLNKIHNPNYRDLFSMGLENIGTLIHALATGNKETRQELESLNSKIQTQSRYSDDSQIQDIVNAYLLPDSNFNFDTLIDTFSDYSFLDKKQGKAVGQKMVRRGERVSGLLDISNHGLSFSDIVNKDDVLDTINNMKPENWEHLEPLSESEKTLLEPYINSLITKDGYVENRTALTPFLEERADPRKLFSHRKYEIKPEAYRQIADGYVGSLRDTNSKNSPHMHFLFDQRVPSDVIDHALKRLRSELKPYEFSGNAGGIQMGPQVFARRSLTPGGYTGHPDVGIHPNRELKVKVGSAVLRKLRDHLEKTGQIRPEDLPKGELWNSITRPITDKSGNVNHVQDWNPLRAANGKLDPSKVRQYIDAMPEMKFIWSHDYWQSPLQRHSNQPSAITMINLHPDTIQTLRDKGLYQDFLDIQRSFPDIHPLGRDTIGWIRHTGSDDHVFDPDGKPNVFVDEVQSDLYNKLRSSSEPKHKQLMDIIFQGFHPSEILHESLQEQMRQQGSVGAPWATHTVASKSPMALDEAKEAPVHFKVSYEQVPKRMGAKPSTYGTLPTQTGDNPNHATQYALQGKPTWEDQIRKTEEPYVHTPSIVEHDYMNGQVKNLYAYKQHIKTNPQGAHVYLDGSHAKTLLTNHSHEKYFDAKNDMIGVLKRIVDEVCDFPCPIYHVGGMKFYVNTHGLKDALKIARAVDKVKDVMPSSEHYKPHFDIGVSENREEAHDAMERANAIKDHHTHPTQTYVVLGQDGHLQKLGMKKTEGLAKSEPLMKSTPAGLKHYTASLAQTSANSAKNASTHNEKDPNLQMFYRAVKESPIAINFPSHVAPLLAQSGRFKNEFETGRTTGGFSTSTVHRRNVERDVLGIPHHAPADERPIYGGLNLRYLLRNKDVAEQMKPNHFNGKLPRQIGVHPMYGNSWVELHPHVNERSTLTPSDTFDVSDAAVVPAKDRHTVFDMSDAPGSIKNTRGMAPSQHTEGTTPFEHAKDINDRLRMDGYVEAQIHGGVDLSKDVHSIHIQLHPTDSHSPIHERDAKDPDKLKNFIDTAMSSDDSGIKDLLPLSQKYKLPLHIHYSDKQGNLYEHVIHPEDVGLTKSESTGVGITHRTPNFHSEWDEATRYPEFAKLGKDKWAKLAATGKPMLITKENVGKINNTDAADPSSFGQLDPDKQQRVLSQIKSGTVEMPIMARYNDGRLELVGGNTRLTALMARHGKAKVWTFDVPENADLSKSEPLMKSTPAGIKHYEAILPTALQNAQRNAETHNEQDPELERYYHIMKTAPLVVNFPTVFADEIAQSGRLKNLFETGASMGFSNEKIRAKKERQALGIPQDAPPEERPIYGSINVHDILRTKPDWTPKTDSNNHLIQRGVGNDFYGDAWFQLHPHVHDRTTVTPNDTFSFDHDGHVVPFSHKHFVFDHQADEYNPEIPKRINNMNHSGYVEAQIHGGVDLGKDVHSVHVQISDRYPHLRADPEQMKSKKGMEDYIKKSVMTNKNVNTLQRLASQYKIPLYVHWADQEGNNYEHVIHPE